MEPDVNAPIPGQSLTEEPGKYPWDRPSQTSDPKKVLKGYMKHLSSEEVMDGILTFVESGIPIKDLTLGLLRVAVSEGLHSPDVSLMVAPFIHERIKANAVALGIDFKEGEGIDDDTSKAEFAKASLKAQKIMEKEGITEEVDELSLEDAQPEEDIQTEEDPMVEVEEPPKKGLMTRRDDR